MIDPIIQFLLQYPIVMKLVVIMGTMRLVFKPLTVAVQTFVDSTPSPDDNAVWERVKSSQVYKWVAFVLDYVGSIKLPGAK